MHNRRPYLRGTMATLSLLAGVAFAGFAGDSAYAAFYSGKTVTLVVGYPAGGSTDIFWRTFAPFWAKHTPGEPQMIVQQMVGASGVRPRTTCMKWQSPMGSRS